MKYDHKRVTPEGRAMGFQMVRLLEPAIVELAAQGEPDERCKSCAGSIGTVPNGCPQTQMDFAKCSIEGVPFLCHVNKGKTCHAWFAARYAMNGKTGKVSWDFSPPDEPRRAITRAAAGVAEAVKGEA